MADINNNDPQIGNEVDVNFTLPNLDSANAQFKLQQQVSADWAAGVGSVGTARSQSVFNEALANEQAAADSRNAQSQSRLNDKIDVEDQRYRVYDDFYNQYSAGKNRSSFDTGDFNSRLRQQYVEAGVATPGEARQADLFSRMQELPEASFSDTLFSGAGRGALAYGAFAGIQGAMTAASPMVAGEAYLPGQVAEREATGIGAPVAGAIGGAIIGTALGVGPVVGAVGGSALAGGAGSLTDTFFASHEFAEERAGTSLGVGRGDFDAVREFTDALRNAATPAVKDLSDIVTAVGRNSPVGAGGIAMLGQAQFTLGTAAPDVIGGVSQYMASSPYLAQDQAALFSSGTISSGQLSGQAMFAASRGNLGAATDLNALATGTEPGRTHEFGGLFGGHFLRDRQTAINDATNNPNMPGAQNASEAWAVWFGGTVAASPTPAQQAQAKTDAAETLSTYEAYQRSQATLATSAADISRGQAQFGIVGLTGGSRALSGALPGLDAGVSEAQLGYAQDIVNQTKLAQANQGDAAIQQQTSAQIATDIASSTQAGLIGGQARVDIYQVGQQEQAATFGAVQANRAYDITRAINTGVSYRGIWSQEQGVIAGERERAGYLANQADTSTILHPAEREAYRQEASTLRTTATEQAYQYGVILPEQQRLSGMDAGIAGASRAYQADRLNASPSDALASSANLIGDFATKVAELSRELAQNNLRLDDRISKEKELASTQSSLIQLQHDAPLEYVSRTMGQAASMGQAAASTYSADVMTGGTGAKSAAALVDERAAIEKSRAAAVWGLAHTTDPQAIEGFKATIASSDAQLIQNQIAGVDYTPSPGLQSSITQASGSLYRMGRGFLEPGNVQDQRLRMFGLIDQEITGLNTQTSALRTSQGGTLTDAQNAEYERQFQGFENQRADVSYDIDTNWASRLPSITVGGTSFMSRFLPSPSQAAAALHRNGLDDLGARVFGSYGSKAGRDLAAEDSGGDLTTGQSDLTRQPGNMTAAAIAAATASALNGVTIKIIGLPSATGTVTGKIQTQTSRTAGMGGMVAGVGNTPVAAGR